MKTYFLVSLCVLLLTTSVLAQNGQKLVGVKKIYLGELGRSEAADLVREKIRLRLMKVERFSLVESAEKADAILTG